MSSRLCNGAWHRSSAASAPEALERLGVGRKRDDLAPSSLAEGDQEHLVDVELAAEAGAARSVQGDGVVAVRERPPQLAVVRPVGQPARRAEQAEDLLAA